MNARKYTTPVPEAWHQVNDWRNDDHEFPIPSTDFGHDLAHFIDVLLDATTPSKEES